MIEDRSTDGLGYAQFSHDRVHRYRLKRALTEPGRVFIQSRGHDTVAGSIFRVVFLMLNPSTADAFKLDPTVKRCVAFARRWEADVLEVVNLFALRSPKPRVVWAAADRGDGPENDAAILAACIGASRVIAAWGTDGNRYERADGVRDLLWRNNIRMWHLGMSKDRHPKHPLARGKHRIPDDRRPEAWT